MADDLRQREVLDGVVSARRRLIAAAPALPWQVDVREAPALDCDVVLLRDAAGGAICSVPDVAIAELVARSVNEAAALLGLEEAIRGHRDAVVHAARAEADGRGAERHQTAIGIWNEAVEQALRSLDRVRRVARS
jgi:hypothetical protein